MMNVTSAVASATGGSLQNVKANEANSQTGKFMRILREAAGKPANSAAAVKLLRDLLQQLSQMLQQPQGELPNDLVSGENTSQLALLSDLNKIVKELEDGVIALPVEAIVQKLGGSGDVRTTAHITRQQAEKLLTLLNNEISKKPAGVFSQEMQQKIKDMLVMIERLLSGNGSTAETSKQAADINRELTKSANKSDSTQGLLMNKQVDHAKPTATQNLAATNQWIPVQTDGKRISLQQQNVPPAFESGPMNRLQQFVLHIDRPGSIQPQQQFAREFAQILSRSRLSVNGTGQQQLTIKLYPEHLGTIDVRLVNQKGQLTATILTQTAAVRELVETHLHQLRSAFAGQNLQVDKLEVMHSFHGHASEKEGDGSESESGDRHAEPEQQRKQEEEEQDTASFLEWLETHLT